MQIPASVVNLTTYIQRLLLALVWFTTICSTRSADDDYADYEEPAPAPAPKPLVNPRHGSLLNRRNPLSKAKPTTTSTTVEPEKDEEEEIDEKIIEEQEARVDTSSTTEEPKKLRGAIIRPFRSNEDLLAALKRRREQASNSKAQEKTPESQSEETVPSNQSESSRKSPSSNKRRPHSSKNEATPPLESKEQISTSVKPNRRYSSRINAN